MAEPPYDGRPARPADRPPAILPPQRQPTAVDRRMVVLATVVVLGMLLAVTDGTIVSVATRDVGRDLGASIATVQWVLTGFMLAFASVMPVAGWAIERFGVARVWIAALLVLMAGSALAGAAWSIDSLIAFRIVQGVGAGMIVPVGQTILAQAAGPHRMGRVLGTTGVPLLLGSVAGPLIGGVVVSTIGWRWVFLVNLPLGILAVLTAYRLLPRTGARPGVAFDLRGVILLTAGVASLIYGVSEAGGPGGSGSTRALMAMATGAALVVLYVIHAHSRGARALIDISLFRVRGFAAAAGTDFVLSMARFGLVVLIPLYWQVVRGHSALSTGLLFTPLALGSIVALPIAGRYTDRAGPRIVVLIGLVITLLGQAFYTQVDTATSYLISVAGLFTIGLGQATAGMPADVAAFATLPHAALPRAASALNTIQRLGASIGTALMAIVLQRAITADAPQLGANALGPLSPATRAHFAPALAHAFDTAFWVVFALIAVAFVPALVLPRKRSWD